MGRGKKKRKQEGNKRGKKCSKQKEKQITH